MSTTFANSIDSNPIYADRAENDKDGNRIDQTYAKSASLATVATTGAYSDLSGTPSIPTATSDLTNDSGFITLSDVPAQVQSDWTESDNTDPSYIQNKPTLATVATSGSYNDLTDKPTIPSVPVTDVTVDGVSVVSNGTAAITMPTIPVTDVEVDGTSVLNAQGVAEITLPTFTQVQADWTESDNTDPSYIQNKPTLATVATSGAYSDLTGTPTINNVPAVTSSDDNKVLKASYTGGVGSYSWETESGGSNYTAGEGIDITSDVISVDHDSTLTTNSVSGSFSVVTGQWGELPYIGDLTATLAGLIDGNGLQVTLTNGKYPTVTSVWPPSALYLCLYKDASHIVVLSQIPGVTFRDEGGWYSAQGVPNQVTFRGADYDSAKSTDTWSNVLASPTSYKLSYVFDCTRSVPDYEIAEYVGYDSSWTSGQTITTGTYDASSNQISVTNPVPSYNTSTDAGKKLTVGSNGLEWVTPASVDEVPDVTSSDDGKVLKASYTGGVGTYSWETESGGGGAQADWTEADSSDPSYIQNKPVPKTLVAGTGITITESSTELTVSSTNQLYNAGTGLTLNNATFAVDTSVVATQSDLSGYATTSDLSSGLAGKQDTLTAGTGISISNNVISQGTPTTYASSNLIASKVNASISVTINAVAIGPYITISGVFDPMAVVTITANTDVLLWTLNAQFAPLIDSYTTMYPGNGSISYGGLRFAPDGKVYIHQNGTGNAQTRYFTITYLRSV